ncbi:hypothetical protein BJ165DRAFT_1405362 [Panaeolus papilionaceus]|nr:hypothetical protein BJ165DRAFT_1405362 [Panaeolus papilionaceus]
MSIIEWSTPTRATKHGGPIDQIPLEIYREILNYIWEPRRTALMPEMTRKTLSSVAQTCRFFASVALPLIFESLCFVGRLEVTNPKFKDVGNQNPTTFCREVLAGNEEAVTLAMHVKQCLFVGWCDDENDGTDDYSTAFLTLYYRALSHMRNIHTLYFNHGLITKRCLKSMASLQNLSGLLITRSRCVPKLEDSHWEGLKGLRLKYLTLALDGADQHSDGSMIPNFLKHLDRSEVTWITIDHPDFLPLLAKSGWKLPKLSTLHLQQASPLSFSLISKDQMPSLVHLCAGVQQPEYLLPFSVSPDAYPILQELVAPYSVCRALVTAIRTISSLTITSWSRNQGEPMDTAFLLQPYPLLSKLQIPYACYRTVHLAPHVPNLRMLTIHCFPDSSRRPLTLEEQVASIVKAWSTHPLTVEELGLRCKPDGPFWSGTFDLPSQVKIASIVVWTKSTDKEWRPKIPFVHQRRVSRLLQEETWTDYEGCFQGVLDEVDPGDSSQSQSGEA